MKIGYAKQTFKYLLSEQLAMLKALDLKQYHTNIYVANKFGVSKSTLLRNIAELREAG